MEGAEPLPRRSVTVLPKLTTALLLITKRAQHPKNTQKRLFRQAETAGSLQKTPGGFVLIEGFTRLPSERGSYPPADTGRPVHLPSGRNTGG